MTKTAIFLDPATRAEVLAEAIPFIRRFSGRVIVIKYGGNAFGNGDESQALASFAEDIVLLRSVGILPVVVHGGGPQIGGLMERLGKVPEFRDGLRVTDADTLDIARMVLVGKVNRDIVGAINVHGPLAIGLSGEDAGFITASARNPALGFVGDVDAVDPTLISTLVAQGLVPVIATIGSDGTGQAYNINADTVAGAIAKSIGCEKLIFLTDIAGILRDRNDPSSLVTRLSTDDLEQMIADGLIGEGMIPKAQACAIAVRSGVGSAHILDGRIAHAALLELLTEQGVGTMVIPS
ncbi:MAG TPA: acetylglutamate kinase [Acidimicrobiales bacterium]|nr:acetylglutamate kinase [Acidimicrobiales bacterium]